MSPVRVRNTLLGFFLLLVILGLVINYLLSWQPEERESVDVHCLSEAPVLQAGQALKVMTWNIQYLAGKHASPRENRPQDTVYDLLPPGQGQADTLDEMVRVIRDEQPDMILLQEVDDGSSPASDQDQLISLKERLGDLYRCGSQSYEWKSVFMPNANTFGPIGRKLVILSRFRIDSAERIQLPRRAGSLIERLFGSQPAVLVSTLPISDGNTLTLLNTRLDHRPLSEDDTQRRQVAMLVTELEQLQRSKKIWLLGGNFNLLPPRHPASANGGETIGGKSELSPLTDHFPVIPSLAESSGENHHEWFTHYADGSAAQRQGETLDYLFHSLYLTRLDAHVRQDDTAHISNHQPLIARFLLPQ